MSFVYDQKVVDSMYGSHVVSMAVDYGVDLVKMWPLQTNQELENDVKYAENLQVMFSGMMTQVLLKRSEEVDQSVAEAVYEGMDVLPGVDPGIIRTLMDANRAYDVMASYHGVDGIELFMETARILGIDVETRIEKEIQDLMENLSRTMRSASGFEVDDDVAENVGICQSATVDRNEFARRYLASMTVLDALINLMCYGTDDSQEQAIRVLPVLLFTLVSLWTPPHFWALALFMKSDYAAAGVPMMPVVAGERTTRLQIGLYTIPMAAVAVAPWALGLTGAIYGVVAIATTFVFAALALQVSVRTTGTGDAMRPEKRLFAWSILYLFIIFGALVVDRWVG